MPGMTQEQMELNAKRILNRFYLPDMNDRDDMQQEIMIAFWQAGEKADPEGNVAGYQFKTGLGKARNFFKRQIVLHGKREVRTLNNTVGEIDGDDIEQVDTIASDIPEHPDRRLETELSQAVENAIQNLPEQEAQIANGILAGMNLSEIGREMNLSRQYVWLVWQGIQNVLANQLSEWENR